MTVPSGASVTITNLTFDGNRYSFLNAQTGCGPSGSSPCGPSGVDGGCTPANWGPVIDLNVQGYAYIDDVAFWNSPDLPVYVNNGYLNYGSVYYARSTGAWFYNGGTVANSVFEYNGTAGLHLSGTANVNVFYDTFYQNRYEMPDGSGGGQLYIDYNAANMTVELNSFNGNNWITGTSNINGCYPPATPQAVAGIEIEPGSSNNTIEANTITNNPGNGISVHSVTSVYLSGYYSYPNNSRYIEDNTGTVSGEKANGIQIYYTSHGPSKGVTLDGILSKANDGWAVLMDSTTTGYGWKNPQCLGSNYEASPYYFPDPGPSGFTNPNPSNITTCP